MAAAGLSMSMGMGSLGALGSLGMGMGSIGRGIGRGVLGSLIGSGTSESGAESPASGSGAGGSGAGGSGGGTGGGGGGGSSSTPNQLISLVGGMGEYLIKSGAPPVVTGLRGGRMRGVRWEDGGGGGALGSTSGAGASGGGASKEVQGPGVSPTAGTSASGSAGQSATQSGSKGSLKIVYEGWEEGEEVDEPIIPGLGLGLGGNTLNNGLNSGDDTTPRMESADSTSTIRAAGSSSAPTATAAGGGGATPTPAHLSLPSSSSSQSHSHPNPTSRTRSRLVELELRCDPDSWSPTGIELIVDPPPLSVSALRRHKLSEAGGLWVTVVHERARLGWFAEGSGGVGAGVSGGMAEGEEEEGLVRVVVRRFLGRRERERERERERDHSAHHHHQSAVVICNGSRVEVQYEGMDEAEIQRRTRSKRVKPVRIPLDQPPPLGGYGAGTMKGRRERLMREEGASLSISSGASEDEFQFGESEDLGDERLGERSPSVATMRRRKGPGREASPSPSPLSATSATGSGAGFLSASSLGASVLGFRYRPRVRWWANGWNTRRYRLRIVATPRFEFGRYNAYTHTDECERIFNISHDNPHS